MIGVLLSFTFVSLKSKSISIAGSVTVVEVDVVLSFCPPKIKYFWLLSKYLCCLAIRVYDCPLSSLR